MNEMPSTPQDIEKNIFELISPLIFSFHLKKLLFLYFLTFGYQVVRL